MSKTNPHPLTFEETYRLRQLLKSAPSLHFGPPMGFSIQGGLPRAIYGSSASLDAIKSAIDEALADKNAGDYTRFVTGIDFGAAESSARDDSKPDKPTLICMVGLPYAGKSTHISKMGCPIVAPDAIRLALHGQRFIAEMEPLVWQYAQTMVKALFIAGANRVVLDACNVTRKHREIWTESDEWNVEFRHITTPREMCRERAENAGDHEIMPIIERMSRQWEPLHYLRTNVLLIRFFSARGEELFECPPEWAKEKSC